LGGAGPPTNTLSSGPKPTPVPSGPSSRLATIDMGQKLGAFPPFCGGRPGRAGFSSNTKSPGPRPISVPSGILIHPAVWPQRLWAENGGGVPSFLGWGELGPHLTQCGFIVIRPTVWPQYTKVTDRTGQDRQDRQRSDRIGSTVLQMVAQ